MTDVLNTEVLTGRSETIDTLSAEWAELCDEGASNEPFLRPEWFSTFVRNFENEIDILTVRREGKLRAVLPIVARRANLHGIPVRKLQAVYNLNTQRFDLIHGADETEKAAIVRAVWRKVREIPGWDVFEARLVKKESWLSDVLALAAGENYQTGIWPMDSAPYITLPRSEDKQQSLDDFFRGPRKHLRQELDRRLRRLKELGSVEFEVTFSSDPDLMATYFDLESNGWKGRRGTAATDDPLVARMHEEFASEIAARGALLVYEMKLAGKTIAMSLNIKDGDRTIHWKTSYDEHYARYSPGNLLFRKLLSDCIFNGSTEIDLLSPSTANKRSWASGERDHVAFYIFQRGFFGSLLWKWKFSVIGGLREFKIRLPKKMVPAFVQK
jgi:CelD/BcsL family acetyltransferase involved in cellulose biosynthesis